MRQKGFAPILIVVLIAALVGVYFLFTTNYSNNRTKPAQYVQITPAPTVINVNHDPDRKGWNIYKNEQAHYQISYPNKWVKDQVYNYWDSDDDLVVMDTANQPRQLGFVESELQLSVGHVDDPKKCPSNSPCSPLSFDKELQLAVGTISTNKVYGKLTKIGNGKIANVAAVKYLYEENYEGPIYGYVNHLKGADGTIYSINFFALDKRSIQTHQIDIDKVIKSFKFTQ